MRRGFGRGWRMLVGIPYFGLPFGRRGFGFRGWGPYYHFAGRRGWLFWGFLPPYTYPRGPYYGAGFSLWYPPYYW